MTMMTTRDGTALYTKAWGWGRPVVLIHGWPLNADSWDPMALALSDAGFRAISYDRRGFGRSEQPSRGYDYDTLADDLADVMAFHGINQDAALVGFSMGGGEVARYMSRHEGAHVDKVAFISSVVPGLAQSDANPHGVPAATFAQMERDLVADRAHFLGKFFKDFFGIGILDRPVSHEVQDHAMRMALQGGLLPTVSAMRAFSGTDFTGDLGAIRVPTLIVHGTNDKTVPIAATAHRLASAIPHARMQDYDGEPHGLFQTRQEQLARDLIAFLRGEEIAPDNTVQQAMIDEVTAHSMVAPQL